MLSIFSSIIPSNKPMAALRTEAGTLAFCVIAVATTLMVLSYGVNEESEQDISPELLLGVGTDYETMFPNSLDEENENPFQQFDI